MRWIAGGPQPGNHRDQISASIAQRVYMLRRDAADGGQRQAQRLRFAQNRRVGEGGVGLARASVESAEREVIRTLRFCRAGAFEIGMAGDTDDRAIAQLGAEPARNGEDPALRLPVVRELLQEALAAAPERQRFLMGGITFCGMVPQRAIPFEVICVLGLDEGSFPRRSADGGIDLIEQFRRIGDRDVATDDRYLFLETAMSAGKRLHLSYLGQNVRDGKPRNPATPLAELLAELDARCGIAADARNPSRPWRVQHPLQPFDGRYFDAANPALFTYSRAFAGMTGEGGSPMPSLRQTGMPTAEPWPDPLPLRSLENFFKDPAKALLKDRLQLSLDALDDDARLPDEEPMDGISPLHALASRLFLTSVLPRKCSDPDWQ